MLARNAGLIVAGQLFLLRDIAVGARAHTCAWPAELLSKSVISIECDRNPRPRSLITVSLITVY
jgi:hypothetical protein